MYSDRRYAQSIDATLTAAMAGYGFYCLLLWTAGSVKHDCCQLRLLCWWHHRRPTTAVM